MASIFVFNGMTEGIDGYPHGMTFLKVVANRIRHPASYTPISFKSSMVKWGNDHCDDLFVVEEGRIYFRSIEDAVLARLAFA